MLRALVLAVAIGAPTSVADLAFTASDVTIERSFSRTKTGELQISVTIDGEAQATTVAPARLTHTRKLTVRDQLGALRDGQPSSVRRTWLTYIDDQSIQIGDVERTSSKSSPFLGQDVEFERNETSAELEARLPKDSALEPALLIGLVEDLDLRGLLSGRSVVPGDSWNADLSAYAALLWPGGELHSHSSELTASNPEDLALTNALRAGLEGDLEVTLLALEGDRASLGLRVEIHTSGTSAAPSRSTAEVRSPVTNSTRVESWVHSGTGQAIWRIDAGRLEELHLTINAVDTTTTTNIVPFPSGAVEVVDTTMFAGQISHALQFQ